MKKIARIIAFMFVLVLLFSTSAFAVTPYDTYTYSIDGEVLKSPDAYVTDGVAPIDSIAIGIDKLGGVKLNNPTDIESVQSLTRKKGEAILYETTVFGVDGSLTYLGTVVTSVIEQRMSDPVEMDTYLMGTAGFETAFYYSHISEALQYSVVSHCMLAMIPIGKHLEPHAVIRVSSDVSYDSSFVIFKVTPDDGHIPALYGMYKELLCQIKLSLVVLCHHKQS